MKLPSAAPIIITVLLCILTVASIIDQNLFFLFIIVAVLFFYAPLIYIAKRTGSVSAFYISIMVFVSRVVTFPLIYSVRDDFTESGWTAIKQFDFSSYSYLWVILCDFYAILLILFFVLILRKIVPRSIYALKISPRSLLNLRFFPGGVSRGGVIPLLLLFILVNYFIFKFGNENKIGITGIEPNPLPFRLVGVVYFYLKFIGPFFLLLIIKNSKSKLMLLMLSLLLIFVGISTLSRSTIAMWAAPVVFVAYRNCRSIPLTVLVAIMVTIASIFAGVGRNLMFVASGASVDIDSAVNMLQVAQEAVGMISLADIVLAMASLVARLGGGQELILGAQTLFPDFVFSTNLIFQIFTGRDFGVDYNNLVMLTHGFVPLEGTVAGIAYSGYMLAFMNSGFVIYILFACFSAGIIIFNDSLRLKIWRITTNVKMSNGVCFALNFTFFALFMISWYWTFAFFILIFSAVFRWLGIRNHTAPRLNVGGSQ